MKKSFLYSLPAILILFNSIVFAQEKNTLYYDQNGKGVDTKKKATYYRTATFDSNNNPIGPVQDFYLNGKVLATGLAISIDKFDDSNTRWTGQVFTYNESGKLSTENNYDKDGKLDGIQKIMNSKGVREQEFEYTHGNPTKGYYLVFDKKGNSTKYSYLTKLPIKLSTTDKNIASFTDRKTIYKDGEPVQFYAVDGLTVAVKLSTTQVYGNYYEAFIDVENSSPGQFDFNPSEITAAVQRDDDVTEGNVLTYKDYIKKTSDKQKWSAAFSDFVTVATASATAYSSTSTNASSQNSYAKLASDVTSQPSNQQQHAVIQTIVDGYLKKNTIFPDSRLVGFVNIKYQKADHVLINVPVNGKVYHFEF